MGLVLFIPANHRGDRASLANVVRDFSRHDVASTGRLRILRALSFCDGDGAPERKVAPTKVADYIRKRRSGVCRFDDPLSPRTLVVVLTVVVLGGE